MRIAVLTAMTAGLLGAAAGDARAQDTYHWPRQHAVQPITEAVPGAAAPLPGPDGERRRAEHTTGEVDPVAPGSTHVYPGFEATVDDDGRVRFHDRGAESTGLGLPTFFMSAGRFDLTETLMRWAGDDPYQVEKARFLERTFEQRARMRMRSDRDNMTRAIVRLPGYVDRIWQYREWSPDLRKRVLFALWDECAERGNELMRQGGAQARAIIEGYIRRELPLGTPHAYSAAELAVLNRARSSSARFRPYGLPRDRD